jgi:hypothetical protein
VRHIEEAGRYFDETLDGLTQLLFISDHFDEIIAQPVDGRYLGKRKTRWTAIEGVCASLDEITEELADADRPAASLDPALCPIGKAYLSTHTSMRSAATSTATRVTPPGRCDTQELAAQLGNVHSVASFPTGRLSRRVFRRPPPCPKMLGCSQSSPKDRSSVAARGRIVIKAIRQEGAFNCRRGYRACPAGTRPYERRSMPRDRRFRSGGFTGEHQVPSGRY